MRCPQLPLRTDDRAHQHQGNQNERESIYTREGDQMTSQTATHACTQHPTTQFRSPCVHAAPHHTIPFAMRVAAQCSARYHGFVRQLPGKQKPSVRTAARLKDRLIALSTDYSDWSKAYILIANAYVTALSMPTQIVTNRLIYISDLIDVTSGSWWIYKWQYFSA